MMNPIKPNTLPEHTPAPEFNLEHQTLIMSSHVIIRDAQTKQILVNQRGS